MNDLLARFFAEDNMRQIPENTPVAGRLPENYSDYARGAADHYLTGVTAPFMKLAEFFADDGGYTPGELKSSQRDKLRSDRFAWDDYLAANDASNPSYNQGGAQGEVAQMVFDPVYDLPLMGAAKIAPALSKLENLEGLGRILKSQRGAVGDAGTLIAQHNLRADNLRHAEKMGGIPVPSLAITKKDSPLENFGDITLLADKKLIDPRGGGKAKVYGADVYSPRYPSVNYDVDHSALRNYQDSLDKYMQQIGGNGSSYPDIADKGIDAIDRSELSLADFLTKQGDDLPIVYDNGKPDYYDTRKAMQEIVENKYPKQWQEYKDNVISETIKGERLFNGFTPSGNRRYKKHTLDNVVAMMKKNLRDGEGFNYGAGSVRAKFTPQFKSIKDIKNHENLLINADEFKGLKDGLNDELFALYEKYEPYMKYKSDNPFGNVDTFSEQIKNIPNIGLNRTIEEYFPGAPKGPLSKFADKLRNYPTEYFEANITRPVGLDEFSAAVVPDQTDQSIIDLLARHGLDVEKYGKGGRKEAIDKFKNLAFSILPLSFFQTQADGNSKRND